MANSTLGSSAATDLLRARAAARAAWALESARLGSGAAASVTGSAAAAAAALPAAAAASWTIGSSGLIDLLRSLAAARAAWALESADRLAVAGDAGGGGGGGAGGGPFEVLIGDWNSAVVLN
jgi:hypothetical protein